MACDLWYCAQKWSSTLCRVATSLYRTRLSTHHAWLMCAGPWGLGLAGSDTWRWRWTQTISRQTAYAQCRARPPQACAQRGRPPARWTPQTCRAYVPGRRGNQQNCALTTTPVSYTCCCTRSPAAARQHACMQLSQRPHSSRQKAGHACAGCLAAGNLSVPHTQAARTLRGGPAWPAAAGGACAARGCRPPATSQRRAAPAADCSASGRPHCCPSNPPAGSHLQAHNACMIAELARPYKQAI